MFMLKQTDLLKSDEKNEITFLMACLFRILNYFKKKCLKYY